MLISHTYNYVATAIPPRCRNPRNFRQVATVEVTIAEITADAAPIAFRWRSSRYDERFEVRRFYQGQLYKRVKRYIGKQEDTELTVEEWIENGRPRVDPAETIPPGSHFENHTQADVKAIRWQQYAESTLIIDGEPWEATEYEPCYRMMTFGLSHHHGGTSLSITERDSLSEKDTDYFRADQLDLAIEHTRALARRHGASPEEAAAMRMPDPIEVLIPEAVRLRFTVHPAIVTCCQCYWNTPARWLLRGEDDKTPTAYCDAHLFDALPRSHASHLTPIEPAVPNTDGPQNGLEPAITAR